MGVSYLWEVSRDGGRTPFKVKVAKECPKTFWLDSIWDRKIYKTENPELGSYVGYNNYSRYYLTEEHARAAYEWLRKEEEERRLHSSPKYIKWQNVKEFAKKLKDSIEEMTMEHSSEFNEGYNEALYDVLEYADKLLEEYEIGTQK